MGSIAFSDYFSMHSLKFTPPALRSKMSPWSSLNSSPSISLFRHPPPTRKSSLNSNHDHHGSSSSPYYKGLTDQSFALNENASCPAYPPRTNALSLHHYLVSTSSSSGGESSRYYAGLTDNSLALYGRSDPCAGGKNLRFWLRRKDVNVKKSTVLGWGSSSMRPMSGKIVTEIYGEKVKRKEDVEEKGVRERVLEVPYKVDGKLFEEMTEKEEASGNGLEDKKVKSLRERMRVCEKRDVSESGKVNAKLFEEIADKKEISENVLVGKEKSMRERVIVCEKEEASENVLVDKKKSMRESVRICENSDVSESNKVDAKLFEEITEKEEVSENILIGKKEKSLRESVTVCERRTGVPELSESLRNDGNGETKPEMLIVCEKEEASENVLVDKKKSMRESVRICENGDVSESNKVDAKLFEEITEKEEVSENILVGKKEKSLRESVTVCERRTGVPELSESLRNDGNGETKPEMLIVCEKEEASENVLVGKKKSMRESVRICENSDVSESNKVDAKLFEEITEKEEVSENILVGKKEKSLRESVTVCERRTGVPELSESLRNDGNGKTKPEMLKMTAEKGNDKEYVWASKYQPKALDDFICNREIAIQLQTLVRNGCVCDHFLFVGSPSAGKRSMIRAMLREVFGPMEITEESRTFSLKGEMEGSIEVPIKKSPHHVEVNLSDTKGYEKYVIDDLFKETYGNIINTLPCSPDNCQAIVLYEAERLPKESLLYIRWMLERYRGCSKVFFCCSDESKLRLVKALCKTVHLSPSSTKQIVEILEFIAKQEGIELSTNFAVKIVRKSKNNLRQAIRSLEATCRNKDALEAQHAIATGWEEDIANIAKNMIEEQSSKQLYFIRRKLKNLMRHQVPPDFVYKSLVAALTSVVDESQRSEVAELVDEKNNKADEIKSDSMMQLGEAGERTGDQLNQRNNEVITNKNVTRSYRKIEEFIAKFMSRYKKWKS